ncbi:hypothetical protein SDC9_53667 [bioreactor metagenome]|uniref:Uncharacterized protein n=1 Tax=bioreactor metagenome TaxID=1076179 RepID=A0A644WUT8_9ZZZZ
MYRIRQDSDTVCQYATYDLNYRKKEIKKKCHPDVLDVLVVMSMIVVLHLLVK